MVNSALNKPAHSALSGWLHGLLGVVIFSGSLPATRIAVLEMSPFFLTFLRASLAGLLAILLVCVLREPRPQRAQLFPLLLVACGVVIGFPLLTALALQHVTSAHSIVFLGLLPLCTAIFAVLRGGERPKRAFWLFSLLGSLLVVAFALAQSHAVSLTGDLLMLAAVIVCGLGYAEGAALTRTLGGWQVICWALILSLPVMLPAAWLTQPATLVDISAQAWGALSYVSLFSMLIGFIFWYNGLARGGIAAVGQLQLLQPFFGLALSALLLNERVSPLMLLVTLGVILCVIGSRKCAR
ncbi:DMT family transporter [Kosakonia cowanii]|uniref:DMT family transporter n=1 Tax=Kosakonia TaxID=1330547 RepID=UPI00190DF777|nr:MULTISPECIES: DMT family transporter [Kosakonia]MBK0014879.1 DMT family transporter [Kosakonia sp. S42]UGS44806.1 DMT family transporter [Kosakonia cowanii]